MPTVLTVGSLHYDIMVEADHLPRKDETAIGSRWYPKFGGKGGNQAVSAAKAGVPSRMIGALGDDQFGQFLRHHLRQGQVDDHYVTTLPATASGMSVALQDRAGDYAATIVSAANLHLPPDSLKQDAPWQDVAVLVLQNEIPTEINLAAAAQARQRGCRTVLNAAPFRALPDDLRALIDVLVVNAVEAEMMGTPPVLDLPTALAAARQLAGQFSAVIVTAGGQGLAACGAGHEFTLPAEKVVVVSSHGAGDSFIGALAAGFAQGWGLEPSCRAASAAAARHVSGAA